MKVVISGSFRKHLSDIIELKRCLEMDGIEVLKPNNIDVIDNQENPEFIKFIGEDTKSEYVLEQEYLEAIFKSDAHIIFNKDGYIGTSALIELCVGAGNYAYTKKEYEKGLFQSTNSKVYLLEPLNPKYFDQEVFHFVQYLLMKGDVKVGVYQMYQDFGMFSKKKIK
ncbi:MAG: hypothetical protein MR598_04885 [Erysipelotrichaceae bacterium]|nr:hypothetical protein [Erysipelotrichaceae bacterium]